MADNSYGDLRIQNAPDLAGAFSAVRGEQPFAFADDDVGQDISVILSGGKAITGKAVWSANSPARLADADTAEHKKEEAAHEEQHEFARMAAWDAAKVTVGGVEMTNAEAQEGRRAVIQNGDYYAQWAVEHGYIAEDDKKKFLGVAERKYELKKAERENGYMTDAQQREWTELNNSREGRAVDVTTVQANLDYSQHSGPFSASTSTSQRDNPFPTAPQVNAAFAAATSPIPAANEAASFIPQSPAPPKPQSSVPAF